MSNEEVVSTKPVEPANVAPTPTVPAPLPAPAPAPAKSAEMEVDQTVRHAAGQALGPKETLSDAEKAKLTPAG